MADQELPEDTNKVDLEPLKEADPDMYNVVNRRVGTLYGVTKELRGTLDEMAKANKALFDKVSAIEEQGKESKVDTIRAGIKEAAEEGDYERVATLTDELTTIKSSEGRKPAETEAPPPKDPGSDKPDLSEFLTPDEEVQLTRWANETDDNGQARRPWLGEGHPQYSRAMKMAEAAMADPSFNTAAEVMAEVDRLMGLSNQPGPAPVMTSTPPPRRSNSKPSQQATPEQRRAADLMGVKLDDYMAIVNNSEKYADGTMVKILEIED
jgi:hypothetical protein